MGAFLTLPRPSLAWCFPIRQVCFSIRGVSAFPRSCLLLSHIVALLASLLRPCFLLSPVVSQCLRLSAIFLLADSASAFPRSCLSLSLIISHFLPTCVPVLDGAPAFPRPCLPLSPHICACVRWCARLPEALSPIVSPHVCLCWMVCQSSRGLVFLASNCFTLSLHMCACVGCCVPLPEVLSSLVPHCLPTCVLPSLSLFLFPFVAGGLILHFSPNSVPLVTVSSF